jgi:hypothetical protein
MSIPTPEPSNAVLSWIHFGDLHLTRPEEQNNRDFKALIRHANENLTGQIDFALLPGDNAEDGTELQFVLAGTVGWLFSQSAVFCLVPISSLLAASAVLSIPGRAIDHAQARGLGPLPTLPRLQGG